MDLIHRPLFSGRFAYVISFHIARSSYSVSRRWLTSVRSTFNIEFHPRRPIHNWIAKHPPVLKNRTPQGLLFGDKTAISSGIPQGGVL